MFKSIAVWPDTIKVGNVEGKNESVDTHETKGQAEGVCRLLERQGFGGDGKVFPISTRVEPVPRVVITYGNDFRECWQTENYYVPVLNSGLLIPIGDARITNVRIIE